MTNAQIAIWAIVELMGHTKAAGCISIEKMGVVELLRVDVPILGNEFRTVHFGPAAIFAIHPSDETQCRLLMNANPYKPAHENEIADFLERTKRRLGAAKGMQGILQTDAEDNAVILDEPLHPNMGVLRFGNHVVRFQVERVDLGDPGGQHQVQTLGGPMNWQGHSIRKIEVRGNFVDIEAVT